MAYKNFKVLVETAVDGDHRASVAEATVRVIKEGDGQKLLYSKKFAASAVRNPVDRHREDIGAMLAAGRALEAAGQRLKKVAWGRIRQEEFIANHREKVAKERANKDKK